MKRIELAYNSEGNYIYDINNVIDVKWEKIALLIDVSDVGNEVLLKYGDVTFVKAQYTVLNTLPKNIINPLYIEIDNINQEICNEINKMMACTGYVQNWLKNNVKGNFYEQECK